MYKRQTLVGAMALSGAFYTFEIINARFPDAFINIAFIFLGTALGTRLNGLKIKELLFFIFHGIIVSSILVVVAMITAYLLTYIGFEFIPTFLSFAPGGIHEMVVISVAYNIDPIFVSYHHFLRIFIIVLFGSHTTALKVSIERENFRAIQVSDLSKLSADKVFQRMQEAIN